MFSLVEPPAPYVTDLNFGCKGSDLFIFNHKEFIDSWFFGGKNSNETFILLTETQLI